MKKIYIQLLSGAYNLGDELILAAEINLVRKIFKNPQITVATYDENSFFGDKTGIKFVSFFPNNFKKRFFANIYYFFANIFEIFRSDVIIVGGGGIFFDNEPGISFKKNLLEWQIRLFFAKILRKKVIFLGISVEVKNPENQKKLAKWMRGFHEKNTKIFPRDERSTKILRDFGVNAETLFDSVFLFEWQKNAKNLQKNKKTIGISLRGGFLSDGQIFEFKKFLVKNEENFDFIFLSHAFSGGETHNDVIFVEKNFGKKYKITQNMQETFDMYKSVDLVISMRLHATILAAQNAKPVVMIPYWPKTLALAEILGITDQMIRSEDFYEEIITLRINELNNNYIKMQEKISASYSEIHNKFLQKIEKTDIMAI